MSDPEILKSRNKGVKKFWPKISNPQISVRNIWIWKYWFQKYQFAKSQTRKIKSTCVSHKALKIQIFKIIENMNFHDNFQYHQQYTRNDPNSVLFPANPFGSILAPINGPRRIFSHKQYSAPKVAQLVKVKNNNKNNIRTLQIPIWRTLRKRTNYAHLNLFLLKYFFKISFVILER